MAAEFLTGANWGLVIGNFEFDMKTDGEIRYHVSHLMPDGKLGDETIGALLSTALGTADRYWQGLMRVLYAGDSAQDAVDLCELFRFEETEEELASEKISPKTPSAKKPRSKRPPKSSTAKPKVKSNPKENQPSPQTENQNGTVGLEGDGDDRKAA
jgi:hypothetical protein